MQMKLNWWVNMLTWLCGNYVRPSTRHVTWCYLSSGFKTVHLQMCPFHKQHTLPPQSTDFSPTGLYFWSYLKENVYKTRTFTWWTKTKHPKLSYVYWTVHHLDSWIKIDQFDVTCFIISLFTAHHVLNVSKSIFRSLRLIVDLFHVLYWSGSMCVVATVWFGLGGVVSLCRLKHCVLQPA